MSDVRPGLSQHIITLPLQLLIALSGCAILMMLTMGWARETARAYNGYLIYGVMSFEDDRRHYQPTREAVSDTQRDAFHH